MEKSYMYPSDSQRKNTFSPNRARLLLMYCLKLRLPLYLIRDSSTQTFLSGIYTFLKVFFTRFTKGRIRHKRSPSTKFLQSANRRNFNIVRNLFRDKPWLRNHGESYSEHVDQYLETVGFLFSAMLNR